MIVTEYQLVVSLGYELLPHIQGKYEGIAIDIVEPSAVNARVPGVVGVASNCLSKFRMEENQSIVFIVAFLMEGTHTKVVLRCPVQSFNFVDYSWVVDHCTENFCMPRV